MVRLKQNRKYLIKYLCKCSLNSTMVRLKRFQNKNTFQGFDSSQFHYGSIKTNIFNKIKQ